MASSFIIPKAFSGLNFGWPVAILKLDEPLWTGA